MRCKELVHAFAETTFQELHFKGDKLAFLTLFTALIFEDFGKNLPCELAKAAVELQNGANKFLQTQWQTEGDLPEGTPLLTFYTAQAQLIVSLWRERLQARDHRGQFSITTTPLRDRNAVNRCD